MQQDCTDFIKVFDPKQSYVLATLIATEGSTYRKTGTMMLIDQQLHCYGLLSGGCLEQDLALHAKGIFQDGAPKKLRYHMGADGGAIWGLGLGCNGVIEIFLQALHPKNHHQGFADLLQLIKLRSLGCYIQIVSSNQSALPAGWGICLAKGKPSPTFLADLLRGIALPQGKFSKAILIQNQGCSALLSPIYPPTRLLICGGGPDVPPVVSTAAFLGWDVLVVDHRPAYSKAGDFPGAWQVQQLRPAQLSHSELLKGTDAALVMHHHLQHDQASLQHLLASAIPYIGILGPVQRGEQLLQGCGITPDETRNRIFTPVGLDIGADSPQSIALAIIAEIHSVLLGR